ncbi:DUF898 domain-containing protein [Rhodospirillaceae bacterium KN72]|uniref:DUF898 domain-containing protein n=1 Tax=Pacificispira spongiicola TaxID=2729598 RepID=A0A7Y0HF24_9PROT|nr:YjgN family protein [Pacificispira spongiicola]NMM44138.1 DUF898 domain-containing protein [Pacificispira spongiicola]
MDGSMQSAAQEERRLPFSFSGTGKDYFGICLRTFLLAMVTLGIYDAWGTVERRRYLLGHTQLDGHGFDYHAKPWVILLARLIVVAAIIDINIFARIWPKEVALGAALGMFVLLPWLINSAWRFTLRNMSYRNLRFDFKGNYFQALWYFVLLPFLAVFALGLASPLVTRAQAQYVARHMKYGDAPFSLEMTVGGMYRVLLVAIPLLVLIGAVIGGVLGALYGSEIAALTDRPEALGELFGGLIMVVYLLMLPAFVLAAMSYRAALRNAVLCGAVLDGRHKFEGTLRPWRYGLFVLGSWIVAVLSLGFAVPWAVVRIRRYQMDHTVMIAQGDLDDFKGRERDAGDAVGAETGVMEGIVGGAF